MMNKSSHKVFKYPSYQFIVLRTWIKLIWRRLIETAENFKLLMWKSLFFQKTQFRSLERETNYILLFTFESLLESKTFGNNVLFSFFLWNEKLIIFEKYFHRLMNCMSIILMWIKKNQQSKNIRHDFENVIIFQPFQEWRRVSQ